ncbi:MAG: transketolase [Candidatus Eisenbacteria bacterium]|uniref:transketolase n=1 Tax=Eiseniibacteriota bacterium TaxID=2212470 RepID=A0A538TKQ8_UNCEI|nr:MAG: transketolase [Candidatus Eisenbacteria bacterium]
MPATSVDQAQLCVNTIKFLSADAVEKAKSGHPGAPMGAADMAYVLWAKYMRFDPRDPLWPNRDRFVLSAGHASMLLYSLLHLFEFDLPMEELQRFRQWGSKTAGHPEYGLVPGVEATTGPLGQGFANGVGMALAQRMMQSRLKHHADLLNHRVFGIVSDGDLMEGISSEAASLAGHWGLGNLNYLYDDNRVSIEGPTPLAFCEDVGRRFEAYGWHVEVVDGNDRDRVDQALFRAVADEMRPSLIMARTVIAKGAPTKQGTAKAHGEPLGQEELNRAKEASGWPLSPAFYIPDEARAHFHGLVEEKRNERAEWDRRYEAFRCKDAAGAATWDAYMKRTVPQTIGELLAAAAPLEEAATRTHSGNVIQAAAKVIPSLVGGSADLDPMGGIGNGMSLYGSFIPYLGTFLIFSDYMRPSIRLAALMKLRVIYVFTHDSVFLGEDGPTHQPIEQLPSLRLIPGLEVWRPADALETAMAWARAIGREKAPTALLLTRQKLKPVSRRDGFDGRDVLRGGYVLEDATGGSPDLVIVATGSEVPLAQEARRRLESKGSSARVVSMPCVEAFRAEPDTYRELVIPRGARRVVIEAARTEPWCELLGADCLRIGLNRFGASAPASAIAEHLGFTPEAVVETIERWLGRS